MTIRFAGRLTLDHMSTQVSHAFDLPEGVGTLKLAFSHAPHHPGVGDIPHQLSISVYGPDGARGTRHNNADQSPVISTRYASPGYLAGAIEPGRWIVEIDVHRILPPGNVAYDIEVSWDEAETAAPADMFAPLATARRRGPGWYRGDLHGHTVHSDADLSVADYLAYAVERGLDFVALTDHNTVSGLAELSARAGEAITILGGTELTTFNGHALVLGTEDAVEWRIRDGETMGARAAAVIEAGKLFVIAHPRAEGHPFCTGCRWAYSDLLPGPARHVEVWNHFWEQYGHNEQAVAVFYRWLNEGYRMVATAGSDTHRREEGPGRLGYTMVHAEDNTSGALLAALKAGHSYLSSGPQLQFSAITADGGAAISGDMVAPGALRLDAAWSGDTAGLTAIVIGRDRRIARWDCAAMPDAELAVTAGPGDWFTLELRDAEAQLHAMTNPIYVGQPGAPWR